MRQRTLAVLIVMFFICARGFAGDSMDKRRVQLEMDERAVQLASKLKISLGQQEHIKKSRRALSSLKIENIENLIFKIDTVHSKLSEIVIERKDALNSQDKVVMVGKIYECDSFEEARVRLLNELVFCSLPIEMIMERYELSQVDIGNLCIVGKIFDMKAQKYLPSDIHFVRGSTMISLRSETTPSVDIYGIAKALDAVLKSLDMKDDVSSAGDLSAAISPKEREAHIEKLRSQYAEMEGKLLDNLYRECKGGSEDKTYFSPLHAAILAVRAWRVARADDALIEVIDYTLDMASFPDGLDVSGDSFYPAARPLVELRVDIRKVIQAIRQADNEKRIKLLSWVLAERLGSDLNKAAGHLKSELEKCDGKREKDNMTLAIGLLGKAKHSADFLPRDFLDQP